MIELIGVPSMEVNKATKPMAIGKQPDRQQRRESHANADQDHAGDQNPDREEAVQFEGLLAHKLSPEADLVVAGMSREITSLRAQLKQLTGQEQHYQRRAVKHSFLNVVNRHEFYREINHVLSHTDGKNAFLTVHDEPGLMLCNLTNGSDIRAKFGRAALDQALNFLCTTIVNELRATDVLGSMGGDDLGIILLTGGQDVSQQLKVTIVNKLKSNSCTIMINDQHSHSVDVIVKFGYTSMNAANSPEKLVALADQDLMANGLSSDQK